MCSVTFHKEQSGSSSYVLICLLHLWEVFSCSLFSGGGYILCVWGGETWLALHVKLVFYLHLEAIPGEVMGLYFLLDSSTFTFSPSHNLWLLCSQCHRSWFVTLVAKEGKRLLFSLRPCFVKPRVCVTLFSELGFMYILLNSLKSSRHQGLEMKNDYYCYPTLPRTPSTACFWLPRQAMHSSHWPWAEGQEELFTPFTIITEAHVVLKKLKLVKVILIHTCALQFWQDLSSFLPLKP